MDKDEPKEKAKRTARNITDAKKHGQKVVRKRRGRKLGQIGVEKKK